MMLQKKTKVKSLILAILMLAACSGDDAESTPTVEPVITEDVDVSADTPDPAGSEEGGADFAAAFAKYMPDAVVLKIEGEPVIWKDYFYWIYEIVSSYEQSNGAILDYSANSVIDGTKTIAEWVIDTAESSLKEMRGVRQGAESIGVTLDEEDEQLLQNDWNEYIVHFGSEEELINLLESVYLSRELYDEINRYYLLSPKVFSQIYGEVGEKYSDGDTMAYAEENGYMQAQHILLKTIDDNGQPVDEGIKSEKLAAAEEIVMRLDAGDNKSELFEELRGQYDEDSGQVLYPDGYCFTAGTMVVAFEDAVKSMEDGDVSDIVETEYGYHIIMRMPVKPDSIVNIDYYSGISYTLRYSAAFQDYAEKVQQWIDETDIVYAAEFENMDLNEIFG